MRPQSRPARPRPRAVIVALLILIGVLASAGVSVGVAQAAGGKDSGKSDVVCAEDGSCNGDGKKDKKDDGDKDGGKKGDGEDGKKDDGKKDDGKKDGGKKDDGNKKDGDKKDGKKDDSKKDGDKKDGKDGDKKDGKGDKKDGDKKDSPPPDPNIVPGTPCTKAAEACADLNAKKAWLIKDGKVVRGPVRIASGGPGYETPRGDFKVQWKNKDHRSAEFDNAPMPWAVFFTDGGIAFHQGDLNSNSHGCIRLGAKDAEAFFNTLNTGDDVQVR